MFFVFFTYNKLLYKNWGIITCQLKKQSGLSWLPGPPSPCSVGGVSLALWCHTTCTVHSVLWRTVVVPLGSAGAPWGENIAANCASLSRTIFSTTALFMARRQCARTRPDWPAESTQLWLHRLGFIRTCRGAERGERGGYALDVTGPVSCNPIGSITSHRQCHRSMVSWPPLIETQATRRHDYSEPITKLGFK